MTGGISAVTGVVLAAGGSRRLGTPKQLLPYRGATLLETTLRVATACGFGRTLVALGGAAAEVRGAVDLAGTTVVENPDFGEGCGSSIRTAMGAVPPDAAGIVLLLGDQPGIRVEDVHGLVEAAKNASIGVCSYHGTLGHPFWFSRAMFGHLQALHGDKAVWKLVDSGDFDVVRHPVDADLPLDVDTEEDYARLLAADAHQETTGEEQ